MSKEWAAGIALAGLVAVALLSFDAARTWPLVLGMVAVGLWAASERARQRKQLEQEQAYSELVLMMLNGEIPASDVRRVLTASRRLGLERANLLGQAKQFRESIDLALNSKKRDVAESRLQFACDILAEFAEGKAWAPAHIVVAMQEHMKATTTAFHTHLYVNMAVASIEKAEKLKTAGAKRRHLQVALQAIDEGIAAGKGDIAMLREQRQTVVHGIDELGR